jgi:uncharacterized protein (DUF58 family)
MTIQVVERDSDRLTVTCAAERWGRYPIRAHVTANARGGLLAGTATLDAVELYVFPVAPARSTAIPRTELPDRIGAHVGRRVGSGVEYADIRAYTPGDPLRAVNWPVSARRGSLHVTDRLGEQSADVVVLVDTYPQPPGPATEATERTVRGAMQVVQTALRRAIGPESSRSAVASRAGWRPTSDGGSSIAYSMRPSVPAPDTNHRLARWRLGRPFHRAPSSLGSPPCSTRTSRRPSSTYADEVTSS